MPYSYCNKHLPLIWFSFLCDLIFNHMDCTTALFSGSESLHLYSLMFFPSFKKFCSKQVSFYRYGSLYASSLLQKLREDGVYTRPLGNVIYLMCGPCTSPELCSQLLVKLHTRLEEFCQIKEFTKF